MKTTTSSSRLLNGSQAAPSQASVSTIVSPRVSRWRVSCLGLMTLAAGLPLGEAEAKEEWLGLLPPNTVAVLAVKDTQELVADWDQGPVGRFLEDPAARKWLAPLFKEGQAPWDAFMKETTGETLREAVEAYHGASLIAFQWPSEESGRTEPTFVEISELADNREKLLAKAAELLEKTVSEGEGLKKGEEEIDGFTVHFAGAGEGEEAEWSQAYAEAGSTLVEANDRGAMAATLAAIKNGGGAAENQTLAANYRRFQTIAHEAADLMLYVDAELMLEKLKGLLPADKADGGAGAMGNPFSPELIMEALHVKEIHGFGLSIDLHEGASQIDAALLHAEKPKSLLVKMMRGVDTRLDLPAFVPADMPSASVTRWSLLGLYDGLLETLNGFGPMIGPMVQMQMGQMEQQLGIKLREDLFATTDDQVIQLGDFVPGSAEAMQVTGIKLKDEARFVAALEALKKMVGNGFAVFEEKEFSGFKVWQLKPNLTPDAGGQGTQMAYAVAGGYLLVSNGPPEVLHKVLKRMKQDDGESLWDSARVKEALAAMPADATGLGVADGSVLVKGLLAAFASAQETLASQAPAEKGAVKGGASPKAGSEKWFDASALPEDSVFQRYFGTATTGSYSLPDASHYRIQSPHVEAQ